jgi:Domain of unknown function (DUF4167)
MKQAGYSKRPQGRSSDRYRQHHKQTNGDFADGKMRGNPQQSVEKYLILARDAASLGDPVTAENYYQFADHYYRLALANRVSRYTPPERHQEQRENQPVPIEAPPEGLSP